MSYRLFIRNVFLSALALYALLLVLVFVIDPFQHFREASFYKPVYDHDRTRYLNPGFAKHSDYDTAVIGTSMSMNFRWSHINEALGGNMVHLGMPGASAAEQELIMGTVLRAGRAKTILYGLDIFTFNFADDFYWLDPFPFYLYDESLLNDYRYFAPEMLRTAFNVIKENISADNPLKFDREFGYDWGIFAEYGEETAMAGYRRAYNKLDPASIDRDAPPVSHTLKRNFDRHILPALKANPDVEFIVFFPPYSYLRWMAYFERSAFRIDDVLEFKTHVFESLRGLSNVRIFDFHSEKDVVFNLGYYADDVHYSSDISQWIVNSIGAGQYMVTAVTLPGYLHSFKEQMESVDLDALHRRAGIGNGPEGQ